ncbi:hypothetical protein KSP35_11640 [Aquihabitans sp. G128]|uniref:hypothetical protein n=1 Tax=Aquihabitans sp. G128 TaxID=2849779 RepID=UPI001C23857A|nr:hypothetical protein [Aquihabitans sp. G128]QXC63378.1 hypothetical protein KSP35_11640 [Aquihabitans sp. G128]
MRKLSATVGALLLVASLAACSGSGGSDGASSTTTKAPAGEQATTTTAGSDDDGTTTTASGDDETTTTSGGSGESGDAASYAASLAKGLASGDAASDELQVTDDEAACVAPKWIETIGVDALTSFGASPKDLEDPDFSFPDLKLDDEQGLAMIDAFVDCDVDIYGQFADVLSEDLDATQQACLEGELDEASTRQYLASALTKDEMSSDLIAKLQAIDATCNLSPAG